VTGSARFVTGPWRYERVEGAGHWLQLDAPDRVNALLLDFLAQHRRATVAATSAPAAAPLEVALVVESANEDNDWDMVAARNVYPDEISRFEKYVGGQQ
jgi:hypothetical protein